MVHTLGITFLLAMAMLVDDLQHIKCRPFHSIGELSAWKEVVVE